MSDKAPPNIVRRILGAILAGPALLWMMCGEPTIPRRSLKWIGFGLIWTVAMLGLGWLAAQA
jgi:hypothetical protein